jgi:hypothetical protein
MLILTLTQLYSYGLPIVAIIFVKLKANYCQ